ncbi:MAG: type II toxin-antitoxin system VapC family toxin [Candidatus Sulfotelmatobacter sp.]
MILLDTHVVIWLADDVTQISKRAQAAIVRARQDGDGLAISAITLLELAMLSSKGRIQLKVSLESFMSNVEARFLVLPITGRICVQAFDLPTNYPKDPVDRIIGATGMVEGLSLVTADRVIRNSRVLTTVW